MRRARVRATSALAASVQITVAAVSVNLPVASVMETGRGMTLTWPSATDAAKARERRTARMITARRMSGIEERTALLKYSLSPPES
jgi:hypothetical protein